MYLSLISIFLLICVFSYSLYSLHILSVSLERNRLYLEEIMSLLRDGGETSFSAVNSYDEVKKQRDDMFDERKRLLEMELMLHEDGGHKSVIPEVFVVGSNSSVRNKAYESAVKLIDDDVVDYTGGVYDIEHKKVDASIQDADEYAL